MMNNHGHGEGHRHEGQQGDPNGRADLIPLDAVKPAPRHDFSEVREKLEGKRGVQYWRSLEELAQTEQFTEYLKREWPLQAPREMAPLKRRDFMRLMGATLALAGVGGCSYQPPEKIVPYVEQPPEFAVPGKPLYYTTAFPRNGYALGVLAESQMGRPVKIEGNPDHPASLGSTDVFAQASVLQLYDPDRSQTVRGLANISTWESFLGALADEMPKWKANRGAGVRILTGPTTSPTLGAQLRQFFTRYPQARLVFHDAAGGGAVRDGLTQVTAPDQHPVYHFDKAARILSLDCNFLQDEPGSVRYARDFIDGRRVRKGRAAMNRLYVVETTPTITGASADHNINVLPSQLEAVARAIANGVGAGAAAGETAPPAGVPAEWIAGVVKDLQDNRGRSVVAVGSHTSAAVQQLARQINAALGANGTTVTYVSGIEERLPAQETSLRTLVDDINAGHVDTLFVIDSNPVYTAPADLNFAQAYQKVRLRIHLGLYDDETGIQSHWHVPQSHYLETWSDARAYDGTVSIIQPLVRPLYQTQSPHELLAALLGNAQTNGYEIVRAHWMGQGQYPRTAAAAPAKGAAGGVVAEGMAGPNAPQGAAPVSNPGFEKFWHTALVKGVVPNGAAPAGAGGAGAGGAVTAAAAPTAGEAGSSGVAATSGGMELILRPDPTVWDGSYTNNGWLQEIPKPLTMLAWDNAALISPNTAKQLGFVSSVDDFNRLWNSNGQMVDLTYRGRTLRVPIWITYGHPDNAVTLSLGYGRTRAGKVAEGAGFNAYALRTSDAPWGGPGLEVKRAPGSYQLVSVQHHFTMEGRHLAQEGTLEELLKNEDEPEFLVKEESEERHEELPTLLPKVWPSDKSEGSSDQPGLYNNRDFGTTYDIKTQTLSAWGMVIDLNACIGCNTCTIACQAENNIATVGKDQVANHRQMHWIRVSNYFSGSPEDPGVIFQPVPCMHCEKAPCELVCPVEATTHSAEGINEMVYNRCIGTRYCSNNCPYKVRRFNYLQYADQDTPTIQLRFNPDVTVRSRGVMEKCTYCIQRINEARIQAEKEDRQIYDGEVVPACAQACPTRAIIFGDINDTRSNKGKGSVVRQLKSEPLNYTLLTELNTRPRTSYLAKLRNPNPELA